MKNKAKNDTFHFQGGSGKSDFGKRLRERRKFFSLSQIKLAEMINVDKSTIQNYEKGGLPKGEYLIALADILKCSTGWLLMGEGQDPEKQGDLNALKKISPISKGVDINDDFLPDDAFGQFVSDLKEIYDSRDPILIPAIQANLRAFRISVSRERMIQEQNRKIKNLEDHCITLEERLDEVEKLLRKKEPPTPWRGEERRAANAQPWHGEERRVANGKI